MGNESLISYRTVLSSFSPILSKVPPQTLKFLLLPSSKYRHDGKQNMRLEEYGLPACQQPAALCVLIVQVECPQNMKFKLFSLFSSFPTTSRLKSLFSTALLVP